MPPSKSRTNTAAPATINLNFLYLFLSGGASELWGKYGGGVYVAIKCSLLILAAHGLRVDIGLEFEFDLDFEFDLEGPGAVFV